MHESQNVAVVQKAYAAFGNGDIGGVLATFDEHIVWNSVTGAAPFVPLAGERRGIAAVAEYFSIVGTHLQFSRFEPQHYVAQGDKVVALGRYAATTSAGGSFDSEWVMIFTLRDGKVVEFKEFLDSAALNAAFTPTAMPA
jgi:uncharacterized protein